MTVKDFDTLFNEIIENKTDEDANTSMTKNLDKTKVYSISMIHPENRLIVPSASGELFIIEKRTLDGVIDTSPLNESELSLFKELETVEKTENSEKLIDASHSLPWNEPGFIVSGTIPSQGYIKIQVLGREFNKLRTLKGNTPDIIQRLHTLKKNKTEEEFLSKFPEYTEHAQELDKRMRFLTNKLYMLHRAEQSGQRVSRGMWNHREQVRELLTHIYRMEQGLNKKNLTLTKSKIYWKLTQYSSKFIIPFLLNPNIVKIYNNERENYEITHQTFHVDDLKEDKE
jgi:hypothetical protein